MPDTSFPNMLIQIATHTPGWVWALLAGLALLGGKQLFATRMGLRRVIVMPLAMTGLSIYGTLSAFGSTSPVVLAWLAGLVAAAILVLRRKAPSGVGYDAVAGQFQLPGSAVPLALMMAIFGLKYGVGVALALHPALRGDPALFLAAGLLYGAFSGIFSGRALRLLRLAHATRGGTPAPATASTHTHTPNPNQLAA